METSPTIPRPGPRRNATDTPENNVAGRVNWHARFGKQHEENTGHGVRPCADFTYQVLSLNFRPGRITTITYNPGLDDEA